MERKRSSWIPLLIVAVLLPVLYVLSFIPLFYMARHDIFFQDDDGWYTPAIQVYFMPLGLAAEYTPSGVRKSLEAYFEFLNTL